MEAADLFLTLTTSLHMTSLAAQIFGMHALNRLRDVGALVKLVLGNDRRPCTPCIFSASAVTGADEQTQKGLQPASKSGLPKSFRSSGARYKVSVLHTWIRSNDLHLLLKCTDLVCDLTRDHRDVAPEGFAKKVSHCFQFEPTIDRAMVSDAHACESQSGSTQVSNSLEKRCSTRQ